VIVYFCDRGAAVENQSINQVLHRNCADSQKLWLLVMICKNLLIIICKKLLVIIFKNLLVIICKKLLVIICKDLLVITSKRDSNRTPAINCNCLASDE